jgi:CRISPR-associated protein Csb1
VKELNYDTLRRAVALDGDAAVMRLHTTFEPAGGAASRIFPPTFPVPERTTDPQVPYILEKRRQNEDIREVVVLDQVQSEANRAEEALDAAWRAHRLRLPMFVIQHKGQAEITLTSNDLPHRYADAYLRDSLLDGVKFDRTDIGRAFQAATLDDATALYKQAPTSLVYGAWNSHRKGRQAKFPRVYSSEIVGWDPQVGGRKAGRMDPLNLRGARSGEGDEWSFSTASTKTKSGKLSEIGHGNIAPNDSHGGVTITSATRFATLSLTGLARIRFGAASDEAVIAARTVLASLALLGDRLAFGGPGLWLRSGCDLVLIDEKLSWVGRGGSLDELSLSRDGALRLYDDSLKAADAAGLPMDLEPVELTPSRALAAAIEFSLTKAEGTGE